MSTKKFTIKIIPNPPQYDHDKLLIAGPSLLGLGYISKGASKSIGLLRCPACGRENYSMSVSSGLCSWCSFDLNEELHANQTCAKTFIPPSKGDIETNSEEIQDRKIS